MRLLMQFLAATTLLAAGAATAAPHEILQSLTIPLSTAENDDAIVLKNDAFVDDGGSAYLQLGFVAGEMAGVWVKVPDNIPLFKVDYFRVLLGDENRTPRERTLTQAFFQMGVADRSAPSIPRDIENAVQITPGPYWNDIPAQGGEESELSCVRGGQFVGAALEFTHTGAPSVYRDLDGINAANNVLFAIPGGWGYSAQFGLRGDWILRVVGHAAKEGECN